MKKPLLSTVVAIVFAAFIAAPARASDLPCGSSQSPKQAAVGVLAATSGFYAALNKIFAGQTAPMESVWSHANDVTYMGPGGGYKVGWPAVRKDWAAQAKAIINGSVEPAEIRIKTSGNLAVVSNLEKGTIVTGGKKQPVSIRATSIYRNEGGAWKMIGHHTDKMAPLKGK